MKKLGLVLLTAAAMSTVAAKCDREETETPAEETTLAPEAAPSESGSMDVAPETDSATESSSESAMDDSKADAEGEAKPADEAQAE